MGDISKYFNRSEFRCHCPYNCGFEAVDVDLLDILEKVREKFGAVNITCACRCLKHNRELKSKDTSQHINGMAADIWIKGVEPETIIYWVNDNILKESGGLIIYDNFCHIDIRKERIRLDKRTKK